MDRNVERVEFKIPQQPVALRVAAYSRVSSAKDAMLHSLSAQVSHYSSLIQSHEGWLYCGVYADEGITGTKENRENFVRLIDDCRAGKIDLIITKSISRFARNTVTLLETVRELKLLGIGVFFEEQNINTLTAAGELMLTILASYAQEESLSASENQKWRIKKNFEEGMPWNGRMLGYRYDNGVYKVVPDEAKIVRRIFTEYLEGKGSNAITNGLNKDGIPSPFGGKWCKNSIMKILRQYAYTGNLLLQRFYVNNHLEKKVLTNQGEKPMYHVEQSHQAIIPLEMFERVQERIKQNSHYYNTPGRTQTTYPLSGKIKCAMCGKSFRRKTTPNGIAWVCSTYSYQGKSACAAKQIPDTTISLITIDVLGLEELDTEAVNSRLVAIIANPGNTLTFQLKDGTERVVTWQDRSRSESWSPEKRKAYGESRKANKGD